jgi:hypothetical protein
MYSGIWHRCQEEVNQETLGALAEEYRQLHTRLTEQVLDKAAANPQWRNQYLEDPQAATANFPEAQRLQQIVDEQ